MLRRRLPRPLSDVIAGVARRLSGTNHPDADDANVLAAVAVVLAPGPDSVLLIRRAERAGDQWSGHMALPGGRRQIDDDDLLATAVRETAEEVGLTLRPSELLGRLTDVSPRSAVAPPFLVRPFVFAIRARVPLVPNPEVALARWIPLDHLLHPETYHNVSVELSGERRQFPAYRLDDAVVWGMTERILTSFFQLVRLPGD